MAKLPILPGRWPTRSQQASRAPAVTLKQDGLRPGLSYLLFSNPDPKTKVTILGEKIPIKQDKKYTLSAWTLFVKGPYPRIGVNFLDKNGRQIRSEFAGTQLSVKGKWSFRYLTFTPVDEAAAAHAKLDPAAAFLQPYIEVKDDLGVMDLFLGESAPLPGAKNEQDGHP